MSPCLPILFFFLSFFLSFVLFSTRCAWKMCVCSALWDCRVAEEWRISRPSSRIEPRVETSKELYITQRCCCCCCRSARRSLSCALLRSLALICQCCAGPPSLSIVLSGQTINLSTSLIKGYRVRWDWETARRKKIPFSPSLFHRVIYVTLPCDTFCSIE